MSKRKVRIKRKPTFAQNGVNVGLDNYFQGKMQKDPGINQFGAPEFEVNRSLSSVPREEANLEAEGGEFAIVPGQGGLPETYKISGPRHSEGGVPMKLKPGSFIWSDHKKGMMIKDKDLLAEFGMSVGKKSKKGYTPAQIAKKFDINPYLKVLFDPYSDDMDRETAEDMIKQYVMQLGKLGLLQESMKGFPQGVPDVSKPYLEKMGIDAAMFEQPGNPRQSEQEQMRYGGNVNKQQSKRFPGLSIAQKGGSFEPHSMFDPASGKEYAANTYEDHLKYSDMGYMHQDEMMRQGGTKKYRVYKRGGDVSAFNDGYGSVNFGNAGLGKFIPKAQVGIEFDDYENTNPEQEWYQGAPWSKLSKKPKKPKKVKGQDPSLQEQYEGLYTPQRIQGKINREIQKEEKAESKELTKKEKEAFKKKEKDLEKKYEKFLDSKGWKSKDYKFDEWLQNEAINNNNQKAIDVLETKSGKLPKMVDQAGNIISNVYGKAKDAVEDFDIKSVGKGKGKGKGRRIDFTQPFDISEEGSTSYGQEPEKTKTVKKQNVPQEQVAASKDQTTADKPYYQGDNGVYYKVTDWKTTKEGHAEYKGDELNSIFAGNQEVANQYQYLENTFKNDPDMKAKLADYIRNTAKNTDSYLKEDEAAGSTPTGIRKTYYNEFSKSVDNISDDDLVDGFMSSQHRNMALIAHGYNPNDFNQDGTVISGTPTAKAGVNSIYEAYEKSGVPISDLASGNNSHQIAFEQLGYRGYVDLLKDRDNLDPKYKTKLKPFKSDITGVGVADETGGGGDANISPIDGFGTNTTGGHISQTTDTEIRTPGEEVEAEWYEETTDPADPLKIRERKPAEWWAQDIGNVANLFGQYAGLKKYLPLDTAIDLKKPDVLYFDPSRALAANAEQAAMAHMYNQGFGDSRMASYRGSDITGKGLEGAANILSEYEGKNVPIGNQYLAAVADTANKERMINAEARAKLHQGWTIANQQYDNAKRQAGRNLFEGWRQGLTNKWKTDTLNQLYPQYEISPGVGGRMDFTDGRAFINTGAPGSSSGSPYISNLQAEGVTPTEDDYRKAAELDYKLSKESGYPPYGGSPYAGANAFFNQYSGVTNPFYIPSPTAGQQQPQQPQQNPYGYGQY